ncbi:hypothetical protein [Phenylobacterium sp.]|uniref:hypothetical protein n=1 Tax=Phenylobacterium sp. TaxID=1871053 RepID=UPI002CD7F8BA|nr:hypothetical protein [Phenylobacterium sp.]HLZ75844.1 hypothetical protein [Phenylobacterium sp.]
MLAAMLAGAILAAAEPAATPPSAAPPATAKAPTAKVSDPNALVCHSEQLPGSRLSTRVCMTQAEAERRRQMDRQGLNAAQAQSGKPADAMMMTPH